MKTVFLLILLTLTACRTSRTTADTTTRRTDTVAAMASRSASTIDRELVWEKVIVRPDTVTGELRVVARDIVRHTEKAQSVQGDTTHAAAKAETYRHDEMEEKTATTSEAGRDILAATTLWGCVAVLAAGLAIYLALKWKSRIL